MIVAATAGSLRICTEVKGTSSCGGQGFFLLMAILAVAVLVGTALLRFAQVPEPGSTSFLAVGLLSVATLLFLVGSIFQWWMVIVIPLVSMVTFLLAHWVTSTYVDPANDGSDPSEPEPRDAPRTMSLSARPVDAHTVSAAARLRRPARRSGWC